MIFHFLNCKKIFHLKICHPSSVGSLWDLRYTTFDLRGGRVWHDDGRAAENAGGRVGTSPAARLPREKTKG